jgi:hypothetical protein
MGRAYGQGAREAVAELLRDRTARADAALAAGHEAVTERCDDFSHAAGSFASARELFQPKGVFEHVCVISGIFRSAARLPLSGCPPHKS